jgi:uncharacterized protein YejL (UPF0352 family)
MVEFHYIQKVSAEVNILTDLIAVNDKYKFGMELSL